MEPLKVKPQNTKYDSAAKLAWKSFPVHLVIT